MSCVIGYYKTTSSVTPSSEKNHVSINQFINSAVAEKIAAFRTEEDLSVRAKKGNRSKFLKVLDKVRNVKPSDNDQL